MREGASEIRRRSSRQPILILIVAFAAWFILGMAISNPYYRLLMTLVPIWATLAVSWNIFSGYSGLVSFGHAAFFGLGAFTAALSLKFFDLTPWIGIPLGGLVGALSGAAIGYPTFRLRGSYFALAMLAYPLALIAVFEWMGFQEIAFPMKRESPIWYAQFSDYRAYLALALLLLGIAMAISLSIEKSRFGLSLLAIKQNELAAEAAGVDTFAWKLRAMILSAGVAGTAGALYAVVILVITPASVFGVVVSAQAMILTLFGGAGTLWGPLIGAVVLVPLSETLHAELGHRLPGIQGIVYGAAIVLVIVLAPEGLYWRAVDIFRRGRSRQAEAAPGAHSDGPAPLPQKREPPVGTAHTLLEVKGVSRSFGGLRAVNNVSFMVPEGAIIGIIGPNGAGKTTLFNLLNGIDKPDEGEVVFQGQSLNGLKPNRVCKLGIGRTFQVARAFQRMSVIENVVTGAFNAHDKPEDAWAAARKVLDQVGLTGRAETLAVNLTSKELRLMELARALAGNPKLILMDEPLAGLGASETEDMIAIIRALPALGVTVVIIEHTMHAMVSTVDRFIVLDHGSLLASGLPEAVTKDPRVIEAYLGRKWAMANAAG
jgi:branched-chain amino acid transport system permease protein